MQDIGPDMEELFRRASENYPLKLGEDKWSEIASKINDKPIPQPANKQQSRYRKYYSALFFLLMFLSLDSFFSRTATYQNAGLKNSHTNKMNHVTHNSKTSKGISYEVSEKANIENILSVSKNKFSVEHSLFNRKMEQKFISTITDTKSGEIKNVQSVNQPINLIDDVEMKKVLDESTTSVKNIKDSNSLYSNNNSLVSIHSADTGSRVEQFIASKSNPVEKKVPKKSSVRRFYYGLLLGPELNSIENQDLKKVGFDIGLMGGYRFTRHLSVETGVLFSKKHYTTAGEYFSMKEIGPMMPAAMKVMDVKGTSKVVQIPLHLRYDVFNKKDHRFFSSVGFSSCILTKESNQYHTSLNGTEAMMYATYKKNRGYFATSLDLAVGYEKNFGKKSNIRIQPYLQLPVKGIGVGNLKVMSTGIHIAITRSAQ